MTPVEVRRELTNALNLDLVGPDDGLGSPSEVLSQAPSRWYLTGFLVPLDAEDTQRVDEDSNEEVDAAADAGGADDATPTEPASARKRFLPSSIGLSVLVPEATRHLFVRVRWGDYKLRKPADGHGDSAEWERTQLIEPVELEVPKSTRKPRETEVNGSNGLKVALSVRPVPSDGAEGGLPKGTRSVSVFLVNRRDPAPDETRDDAFVFQSQLAVKCEESFVPRPNLRSLVSDDWDERVADLQYRDACEFAVGHNVATEAVLTDCDCHEVRTCWIPGAEVERVAPAELQGIDRLHGRARPACRRRRRAGETRQPRDPVSGLDRRSAWQNAPIPTPSQRNGPGAPSTRPGCCPSHGRRDRAAQRFRNAWRLSGSPTGRWPPPRDVEWE